MGCFYENTSAHLSRNHTKTLHILTDLMSFICDFFFVNNDNNDCHDFCNHVSLKNGDVY